MKAMIDTMSTRTLQRKILYMYMYHQLEAVANKLQQLYFDQNHSKAEGSPLSSF